MFNFDLRKSETALYMYRQSESVLLKSTFYVLVVIYLPWSFLLKYDLAYEYRWALIALTLLAILYAVNAFLLWSLNVLIVTNQRVILFKYQNLLKKTVQEAELSAISSLALRSEGFFARIAGLASLDIFPAGSMTAITARHLSHGQVVKEEVAVARAKYISPVSPPRIKNSVQYQ